MMSARDARSIDRMGGEGQSTDKLVPTVRLEGI